MCPILVKKRSRKRAHKRDQTLPGSSGHCHHHRLVFGEFGDPGSNDFLNLSPFKLRSYKRLCWFVTSHPPIESATYCKFFSVIHSQSPKARRPRSKPWQRPPSLSLVPARRAVPCDRTMLNQTSCSQGSLLPLLTLPQAGIEPACDLRLRLGPHSSQRPPGRWGSCHARLAPGAVISLIRTLDSDRVVRRMSCTSGITPFPRFLRRSVAGGPCAAASHRGAAHRACRLESRRHC